MARIPMRSSAFVSVCFRRTQSKNILMCLSLVGQRTLHANSHKFCILDFVARSIPNFISSPFLSFHPLTPKRELFRKCNLPEIQSLDANSTNSSTRNIHKSKRMANIFESLRLFHRFSDTKLHVGDAVHEEDSRKASEQTSDTLVTRNLAAVTLSCLTVAFQSCSILCYGLSHPPY